MPIYDYRCAGCGAQFERLVRAHTAVACPKCAGERVERLMSVPARPAAAGKPADYGSLGPPSGGGGCCGGACHSHVH
ncbi:MAG TPA: zinc ribbon domain-containing protein [Gemmatimonadales bacterium]|nr:zinc ribbon domain-containing protein [Gemmatimonadales bacterium]